MEAPKTFPSFFKVVNPHILTAVLAIIKAVEETSFVVILAGSSVANEFASFEQAVAFAQGEPVAATEEEAQAYSDAWDAGENPTSEQFVPKREGSIDDVSAPTPDEYDDVLSLQSEQHTADALEQKQKDAIAQFGSPAHVERELAAQAAGTSSENSGAETSEAELDAERDAEINEEADTDDEAEDDQNA